MGWQKRSSGHSYSSNSGHGLVIGKHTRKVIDYIVKIKSCPVCQKYEQNENIPDHICIRNHHGSSKSMEVDGIIEMLIRLFDERHVGIISITADDDITMSSHLQHAIICKGKQLNKGRIPPHILVPQHLADPSHRKKVVGKHVYQLATASTRTSTVDKSTVQKILKGWGYMLHSLRKMDPHQDMPRAKQQAKAVLEHRFGNHKFCDSAWCYAFQAKSLKRKLTKGTYLCKKRDEEAYTQLYITLQPFSQPDRLAESMHQMNTQRNEAMNAAISRLVPKTKHISKTNSLKTRVAIAISCANMGFSHFHHSILQQISDTRLENDNIQRIENKKLRNYERKCTPDSKHKRIFIKDAKSKSEVLLERLTKKRGDYGDGIQFDFNSPDL